MVLSGHLFMDPNSILPQAGTTIFSIMPQIVTVQPNHEVILFDPVCDSYAPAIELNDGICVHTPICHPVLVSIVTGLMTLLTGAPDYYQLPVQSDRLNFAGSGHAGPGEY